MITLRTKELIRNTENAETKTTSCHWRDIIRELYPKSITPRYYVYLG